jgi:hypothetical protein
MIKVKMAHNYILILIVAMLSTTMVVAQNNIGDDVDSIETLFGNKEIKSGGYGAFEFKLSPIDGSLTMWTGGRGAWIINHSFAIGAGGYGLIPSKKINCPIHEYKERSYITGGYGGLFVEYSIMPKSVVHFSVNCLLGAGGLTYFASSNNYKDFYSIERDHPYSVFFVAEPGIAVELNVAKWFRLGLEASYRIAPNSDLTYTESGIVKSVMKEGALDGISVGLAFKFGKF